MSCAEDQQSLKLKLVKLTQVSSWMRVWGFAVDFGMDNNTAILTIFKTLFLVTDYAKLNIVVFMYQLILSTFLIQHLEWMITLFNLILSVYFDNIFVKTVHVCSMLGGGMLTNVMPLTKFLNFTCSYASKITFHISLQKQYR